MSSQRRESRWQRKACTGRAETWSSSLSVTGSCSGISGASGGTTPPETPARWVTDSLHTDHRFEQCAAQIARHGVPPLRAGSQAAFGPQTLRRLSLPHIPTPPGFASVHPTSPQAPAALSRRAERYDGKGNLYLFDAA